MKTSTKILSSAVVTIIMVGILFNAGNFITRPESDPDLTDFPDFYTSNEDFFVYRLGTIPDIDRDSYRLEIHGLVDSPTSYTLEELQSLHLVDLPLTIECIGNPIYGRMVSTAMWRGFVLYDLLETLGVSDTATGVKYLAADGYYASHTMEQLRNNTVLGALYMNGEELPPVHGFPLRILNPGYYGVKQPAWVTEIEVIDRPLEDFWEDRGWDTSPPMDIDSKIFFPAGTASVNVSENLRVGGCAFGGTRVKYVEYTLDGGTTWQDAEIIEQIDADNVWVFWEINISFPTTGQFDLRVRATDFNDNHQIEIDYDLGDGTSSWPVLEINVV